MGTFRYLGTAALIAHAVESIHEAVKESADDLVEQAKGLARVRTGAERGGIHVDGVSTGGHGAEARVTSSEYYDIFQHEGTSHMTGTKFLEKPLLDNAGEYRDNIARAAKHRF